MQPDEIQHRPGQGREPDAFETIGSNIAAILRSAQEAAEKTAADAEAEAAAIRAHAESAAAGIRAAAESVLDRATADAERIRREAVARAEQIEIEIEARFNNRREEAEAHERALRNRLLQANEELQLALMAIGEPVTAASLDLRGDDRDEAFAG